jgi:hypothetical protein
VRGGKGQHPAPRFPPMARNMVRAGISKLTAKRISGHATDSVIDRYDIGDKADLEDPVEKLQARKLGAN